MNKLDVKASNNQLNQETNSNANPKIYHILMLILIGGYLLTMGILCFFKEPIAVSETERRALAQRPVFSQQALMDGSYIKDFENYSLDQFPFREKLRTMKSFATFYGLMQLDQNDIYIKNGYASAYVYPQNEEMLDYAADRIQYIYDQYLSGTNANTYFAIVPDKNCYLDTLHPSMDYDKFIADMESRVDSLTAIHLQDTLSLEDYYYTDTHIRQDHFLNTARKLANEMQIPFEENYNVATLDIPFYGVYYGQSALPLAPDTIRYMTNDILEQCIVTSYDTGKAKPSTMYDYKKAEGKDPYEFFLSGSVAIMTIDNPNATTDKELILFRDSYGSSLAPLLACSYSKITLIDTRYVNPAMLGNFIQVENQDVLFLYSSLLLNNSLALKK